MVLDTLQNVYVTGVTSSRNFPLVNAIQPRFGGVEDGFVVTMRSDGRALLYSTYLG
ncbi:MAG: cell surface protein, partial [Acidobacteriota bacterium]